MKTKIINTIEEALEHKEDIVNLTIEDSLKEQRAKELRIIEGKLATILDSTYGSWTKAAILIMKVQDDELWKVQDDEGNMIYSSFTQWMHEYSDRVQKHESYIWKVVKAGKTYKKYSDLMKKQGEKVTPLEELKVDRGAIELAEKIAGSDKEALCKLCKKIEGGTLNRNTLKTVWHEVREKRQEKQIPSRVNSYTPHSDETVSIEVDISDTQKTLDITSVFMNAAWCNNDNTSCKYKAFKEFPVRTGVTRHARRLDVLAITNAGIDERDKKYKMRIIGIEVKVSLQDLKKDKKMNEYKEFVDEFYIAIPAAAEDMKQTIIKEQSRDIGILLVDIDKKKVKIQRESSLSKGKKMRDETLATAIQIML